MGKKKVGGIFPGGGMSKFFSSGGTPIWENPAHRQTHTGYVRTNILTHTCTYLSGTTC